MDYTTLIAQFGVMGAILVGVLFAIYQGVKWVGSNVLDGVAKPLAARHLAFIERIEALAGDQALVLAAISKSQDKQTEVLGELKRIHEVGHKTLEALVESRNVTIQAILDGTREIIRRLDVINLEQLTALAQLRVMQTTTPKGTGGATRD